MNELTIYILGENKHTFLPSLYGRWKIKLNNQKSLTLKKLVRPSITGTTYLEGRAVVCSRHFSNVRKDQVLYAFYINFPH